jgi:glycine cleavage system H lipoate-binding protein
MSLEIDYCNFPDVAFYDLDNNTWVRMETAGIANVGITSVHATLSGRLTQIKLKPVGAILQRGQMIATIERT